MKKNLERNYQRYQKKSKGQKTVLVFLRDFMPEIIFRTTKLEGETVTRKTVRSIF